MDWKVLYVKSRNEKKVMSSLLKLGIKAYCPLITEVHQWSDRKKKVQVPLINSYVFVQLEESQHNIVFQVPGVLRYLFWMGNPAIVRDKEIELMQNWLSNDNVIAHIESLQPGDYINIKAGPFEGKKGIVQEINKNRIQLLLLDLEMKITLNRNLI
ncbi:UpxY family transcription antiterminator [Seonamhaeicola sp. MEBiC1930]|uniref:UpxY family transcription antiterminator n=1 Tax=Seonamhaeicola sp. MEBiC01930 TaxID=2976768 RepID=UPI00324406BA